MCLTGDWLMFMAHSWRSHEQSLAPTTGKDILSDHLTSTTTETDLAIWFNQKFAGFWSLYFPVAASVSYLFFFGIGGYLHVRHGHNLDNSVTTICIIVYLLCKEKRFPRGVEMSAQ